MKKNWKFASWEDEICLDKETTRAQIFRHFPGKYKQQEWSYYGKALNGTIAL